MKMVHKYEEFCQLHDQGKVRPDVNSNLGYNSVQALIKNGWQIKDRNWLGVYQKNKVAEQVLRICRESAANFEFAYRSAGIDFWIIED